MAAQAPPKSRHFTFTLNNDAKPDIKATIDALACQFLIYGKEICPTTQTPHLQGHVWFKNLRSIRGTRSILKGCHVEIAKAPQKSIEYCRKDGR